MSNMRISKNGLLILLIGIFCQGCSYIPKIPTFGLRLDQFPGVYKVDIQQGNVISQEMVDQLRPGMTRRQVAFVMGTPLIQDSFNADRWDYVYSFQPGGEVRQQESLSLYFDGDLLSYFEGDFVPSQAASASSEE